MNVGFIGLGAMGLPMAKRIVAGGHRTATTVHRTRGPADELAALGAAVLATPADVARVSDVVITILPADRELKDVVLGASGALQGFSPGKVLIEMTTGTAAGMEEVAHAIEAAGGEVLDAPVSGGTPAAAQGTLTIMVGGDPVLLERCRPVLEAMGKQIVHVGAVGQGKVVKMVNQVMAAAHLLVLGEAFALGVRCGADPRTLYEVVKTSSGYSRMMDLRLPGFLLEGRFEPGFRLDLMKKDVNLALESARALNMPMMMTAAAGQLLSAASASGRGDADFSAAAQYVAGMANVQLHEAAAHGRDPTDPIDGPARARA
jgi:3-hydroxyisobutyrate dehydrogenase-like beta-hydroxyacid dehydrogenase